MADLDFTTRGPPGADGNSFLWFRRDPTAADGRYGDTAININTTLVFIKDESGVWQPQFEMRGKRGVGGLPGPQGFGYLSGSAAPSSQLGRDGDFYVQDTASGPIIYGPKAAGQWPTPDPLVPLIIGIGPPQASTGYDGQAYLDYQNAVLYGVKTSGAWPAGTTMRGLLVGSGAPNNTLGYDGQTYIDSAALAFYGPKANGVWPTVATPLVGVIYGTGAPSAGTGINGQFYIDTAVSALYGPKAGGAWPSVATPLVGVLVGTGAPAAGLGLPGQVYIDTAAFTLYGPKTGSGWGPGSSFLGKPPFKPVVPWATGTAYSPGPPADLVQINGSSYACLIAHTSGTFSTDLAAGRWGLIAAKGTDGTGTGTVQHNGTPAAGRLARFADTTGDLIEDAGVSVSDILNAIPTRGQIVGLSYGPDALA